MSKKTFAIVVFLVAVVLYSSVLIVGCMNKNNDSQTSESIENNQTEFFNNGLRELNGSQQITEGDTGEYNIEIKSAKIAKNHAGEDCVVITYVFENNSNDDIGFMSAMDVEVYQNGVSLSGTVCKSDSEFQFRAYNRNKVKPGSRYEFSIGYLFEDTNSDIVVEAKNNDNGDSEFFFTRTFEF